MSDAPRLRDDLDALPRYRAGRPAAPRTDRTPLSLASNESPFPSPPGVLAAVTAAAGQVERYPSFGADRLITALSNATGHPADGLCVGTGSVALLQHLIQIACHDGDEVVFAWRSFEAYPIVTRVAGAVPIAVPLTDDHRHDLPAMLVAVTERTRVLILCSPNNPTGTALAPNEVRTVLSSVSEEVLVILDEAYLEYVTPDHRPDVRELLAAHANLVVLRTFSKAYGLAGLRVGYSLASPTVTEVLRAVATPFGVNALAQAAAVAALASPAAQRVAEQAVAVATERDWLAEQLDALGLPVTASEANFVWLPLGPAAGSFAARCQEDAISVRLFDGEGVRITIADRAASQRVLAVAAQSADAPSTMES